MAKTHSDSEKRKLATRRGEDRRNRGRRLDERRKGGFGEITPDRRVSLRRVVARRKGHRRKQ